MNVSVILPTYNEKGNIVELITAIHTVLDSEQVDLEIVVVDDNSPDGTAEEIRKVFGEDKRVSLFVRKDDRGLATAIRYGIEMSKGDVLIVMDTDFNHDPQMLPQFIHLLKYFDVVVGSRFVLGGGMKDRFRYYCSMVYTVWLRIFLGIRIGDKLSGFYSIRKEKLFLLDMNKIFYGYGDYFIRLLLMAQKKGYRMLEVPTFYQLRMSGDSKTNFINVFYKYTKEAVKIFFSKERWQKSEK